MFEMASRMAIREGAKYLEKLYGGRDILLSGVLVVASAEVVALGGGAACLADMPGNVPPITSTSALTSAILPYAPQLQNKDIARSQIISGIAEGTRYHEWNRNTQENRRSIRFGFSRCGIGYWLIMFISQVAC